MNEKLIKTGILFGLAAAFGVVSLIVVLTRGKSGYFIGKKLKIGAAIIGLTGTLNGCGPESCYVPVSSGIYLETISETDKIEISGTIERRYEETGFSYRIIKEWDMSQVLQEGNILPSDGELDSEEEKFSFKIDNNFAKGRYRILTYLTSLEESSIEDFISNSDLIIIGEDGKVKQERVIFAEETAGDIRFVITNKESQNYSYVITSAAELDYGKVMAQGDLTAVENSTTKMYELVLPKSYEFANQNIEVKIYGAAAAEIGTNYENFVYRNDLPPKLSFEMID